MDVCTKCLLSMVDDNHIFQKTYQKASNIYFGVTILDLSLWTLQPLVILLFKKNQDMFSCFSKVDDMALITMF